MDANKLRALAKALEHMDLAPCKEAADYLRAQADAQPVAWIGPSRPKIDGADHRVLRQDYDASHGYGWSRDTAKANGFLPLYTHPAPAPSQGDASRMIDALQSIRAHVEHDPSALAAAIVATCDSVLDAAPQAEPMADSDADYWLRNRQPILDAIERAGFMLMSNASGFWLHPRGKTDAQAEPQEK